MNIIIVTYMMLLSSITLTIINPAMPTICSYFNTTVFMMKVSMTVNFLGYALSIIIYGHYINVYGRKKPFIIGVIMYALGTLLCLISRNEIIFIIGRLIQGTGEGASLIGLAIVKDLYHGNEYNKKLSKIFVFMIIGPAIAPILGGIIITYYEWQYIFVILFALNSILIFMIIKYLTETKIDNLEKNKSIILSIQDSIRLFKLPNIRIPYIIIFGAYGVLFSNISNLQFLYIESMKLTPIEFSLYSLIYTISCMITSNFLNTFIDKYSKEHLTIFGIILFLISAICMIIAHFSFTLTALMTQLIWIPEAIGMIVIFNTTNGWILNSLTSQDSSIGVANIEVLKLLSATIVTYLTGFIQDGTILPLSYVSLFFSSLSLMLIIYILMQK